MSQKQCHGSMWVFHWLYCYRTLALFFFFFLNLSLELRERMLIQILFYTLRSGSSRHCPHPTPSSASLFSLSLLSSQFDLQDKMASSVVRVSWYGGRPRDWGFVGETPASLGWEDNYQVGNYQSEN